MHTSPPSLWHFGPFTLDRGAEELFKSGRRVALHAQPLKLLTLLVARAGRIVTREEIQEHLWPPGTHVEVDQGINAGIRQIRLALGDSATAPRYLETLPRKGYRFLAPVEGTAPQAASPVPSGAVPGAVPSAAPTAKALTDKVPASSSALGVLAILAVLALAVAGLLTWGHRHPGPPPPLPPPEEQRPVLVVLPFEPLGGEAELAFLADALTEEVISHLGGRYPDQLAVIARTTTMRYRGTRQGVREIAQELGADFLLESSVRTEAGRVRVTAQLIDAQDASHLWAANYDRQPESLLEFQREVSQRIADTLAARLGATPPVPTAAPSPPPSWEGYLLYLKGLEALNRPANPNLNEARDLFRQAIRQDPDFAPAHVALARTLGPPAADPQAALTQAREALDRALALDPELPDAYLALGEFQLYQAFDLDAAKGSLDRALELRPAFAEALHHRAAWFAAHGDTAGVRRDLDRARRLDPLSAAVRSDAGFFAYFDRRWNEALEQSVRTLELEPGYLWAQQCIALTLLELQRQGTPMDQATWQARFARPLADLLGVPPEVPWHDLLPHFWEARWNLLQAQRTHGGVPRYGEMAVARMALGDRGAALAYLDLAAKTHSGWMVPFLGVHPLFQSQKSAS